MVKCPFLSHEKVKEKIRNELEKYPDEEKPFMLLVLLSKYGQYLCKGEIKFLAKEYNLNPERALTILFNDKILSKKHEIYDTTDLLIFSLFVFGSFVLGPYVILITPFLLWCHRNIIDVKLRKDLPPLIKEHL